MAPEAITLKTINNETMHGFAWNVEKPIGNVVIITGMEEYILRYDDFAKFLNSKGYNVCGIDHYGQGENCPDEKDLGIVPRSSYSKMVRNVDDLVKRVKKNGLPTYVFAHSMGSFMLQDYIQRFTNSADKVVICGTNGPNAKLAYKFGYPLAKLICKIRGEKRMAKFLAQLAVGSYAKSIKNRKTMVDWLSYNDESNERYLNDPRCGHPSSFIVEDLIRRSVLVYNIIHVDV